jgi:hypothetical protein
MNKDHHPESSFSENLQYGYLRSEKHTSFCPPPHEGFALSDEPLPVIFLSRKVAGVNQTIRLI